MKETAEQLASRRTGIAQLVAAMTLSGTIGVFVVLSGVAPLNVVFFRCLFGALALGLYCWARGYLRNTGFTRWSLLLAVVGGIFLVLNWYFLFASYSGSSISVATVVYHTQPFYVVLLGALVLGDRVTLNKVLWIVLAFFGVVLVSGLTLDSFSGNVEYLLGIGSALVAAVLYAFATIIAKKISGVRPHLVALVQVSVGTLMLLPVTQFGAMSGLGLRWGWLVALGIVHTGLLYILIYSSFQKLASPLIAVLTFVYPAVAILADVTVFGTVIGIAQMAGIALIVLASLGVSLDWRLVRKRIVAPREDSASAAQTDAERVKEEIG